MRMKGYSNYFGPIAFREFYNDFFKYREADLKEKIWAYRKGFLSKSVVRLKINEENYSDYMPDLTYFKLHPINGKFGKWIDDKLTMKYILNPFNEYLPEYYFVINREKITKLNDCPDFIEAKVSGVIKLLKEKKNFAVKLIAGSLGKGFYKLSCEDNTFYINDKKVTESDLQQFISQLKNYAITEYIVSHKSIRKVYDKTANNLRIMMINDDEFGPKITGAFMKFGTKKSGMIEHVWAGGIFCKIDLEDGTILNPYMYIDKQLTRISIHPDTKEKIEGTVPYWNLIKSKLTEIGNYIPQVKYMGFDVLVTDEGFKIIEINSHQGLNLMQMYYPVMKNDINRRFFNKLMQAKNLKVK